MAPEQFHRPKYLLALDRGSSEEPFKTDHRPRTQLLIADGLTLDVQERILPNHPQLRPHAATCFPMKTGISHEVFYKLPGNLSLNKPQNDAWEGTLHSRLPSPKPQSHQCQVGKVVKCSVFCFKLS